MTRLTIGGAATLAAALLLSGCATSPPYQPRYITVYDCSETLETSDGVFQVDETFLSWRRDLGDGVTISASLSLPSSDVRESFAARGFDGYVAGMPRFLVGYDARHGERNRWVDGAPHFEIVSDLRLGDRSAREWITSNGFHTLPWPDFRTWLAADPADAFVFTLYDTAGARLQRATLPRDGFARAERTLQTLHARVLEKAAARETSCRSEVQEEGQDIVVVGG